MQKSKDLKPVAKAIEILKTLSKKEVKEFIQGETRSTVLKEASKILEVELNTKKVKIKIEVTRKFGVTPSKRKLKKLEKKKDAKQ